MNKIEKRALEGKLKYKNTIVLTYKIEYPEITISNFKFGKNIFNKYNKEKAMKLENYVIFDLYREAKELYEYNTLHGYPIMVYEIILQYDITYNQDYIISLYYDQYEFTGGAHGNTIKTSQTWDLNIGRKLPLSYFYPNNPYYAIDILKNINNQIKKQMQLGNNYYFNNYCELVLETFSLDNYYITQDSLVIFFQQYDIAPYSSGIPVFHLPYRNS